MRDGARGIIGWLVFAAVTAAEAVPLAENESAAAALLDAAARADSVQLANLAGGDSGTLFSGSSRAALAQGRYRLCVPLALTPLAGPVNQGVSVHVTVGTNRWTLSSFDFAQADTFRNFTFTFTARAAERPAISVSWDFETPLGQDGRRRAARFVPPPLPGAGAAPTLDSLGPQAVLDVPGGVPLANLIRDGRVSRLDAREIPHRLLAQGIHLQRLEPLQIEAVRADRLLYAPGAPGALSVRIRNVGTAGAEGRLAVTLVRELAEREPLATVGVSLAGGASRTVEIPLQATGRWGVGVEAVLICRDEMQTAYDYFSVSSNFVEVGIAHGAGPVQTGVQPYTELPEAMRRDYANMVEIFFWSPCDWALHVSPLPEWWSGQTSYHQNEANLRALIRGCQGQGLKLLMYASRHPAGPFGWEAARRRPEWFAASPLGGLGSRPVGAEPLERWNDPAWRSDTGLVAERLLPTAPDGPLVASADPAAPRVRPHPGWFQIPVDLRRSDALDYGIDRLIDGARHYGWDAVRFDGHYTEVGQDAVSTRNMQRLKQRVREALPDFRLGYNYGYAPEGETGVTHELREAMAGGGLYMQEAIRNWRYGRGMPQYQGWRHYATNELAIAKQVKALGGHYHCIWDLEELPPDQAFYKFAYGVIAGAHPYYARWDAVPGCANWGAFLTRWSGMLWDPALVLVKTPERLIRLETAEPVTWQPFVQQRVVAPDRAFLVVHLVRPAVNDAIAKTAFPDRPGGFTLDYTPEPGTRVTHARLVRPEAHPFDSPLELRDAGDGAVRMDAPSFGTWAMVVLELAGTFEVWQPPPSVTEPPDGETVARAEEDARRARPEPGDTTLLANAGPGVILHALNHGSANLQAPLTFDPDAACGTVQWRAPESSSTGLGSYWMTHVPVGEHRLFLRIKWTDEKQTPTPQRVHVALLDNERESVRLLEAILVTPAHPEASAGAVVMDMRSAYHFYDAGRFEMTRAGLVHLVCQVSTAAAGDNALYLESARIDAVAGNSDAALVQAAGLPPKPDGLRAPDGREPRRILLVKGLFATLYGGTDDPRIEATWALPSDAAALYAWDALVLANVDLSHSTLAQRQLLRDYVLDGGRLIVLGGSQTLGQGGFYNTFVADILPVDLAGPYEVVALQPPVALGGAPGQPWEGGPSVFWMHQVGVREGADILAWAGKDPIVITWTRGRGRVTVFAGTTLGGGDAAPTPFWKTDAWGRLLARLLAADR